MTYQMYGPKRLEQFKSKIFKMPTNPLPPIVFSTDRFRVYDYYPLIKTPVSEFRMTFLEYGLINLISECAKEVTLDYHPPILMYGKVCHQQRSVGFYSDVSSEYNYSRQKAPSKPLTKSLKQLLAYVNFTYQAEFNGILINKYENGEEYIGKHSDDERTLDPQAGVVMVSTGSIRTFRLRNKNTGEKTDILMKPDQMYQMWGDFQQEFTHEIPIEKKVKTPRYSFTFRKHTNVSRGK